MGDNIARAQEQQTRLRRKSTKETIWIFIWETESLVLFVPFLNNFAVFQDCLEKIRPKCRPRRARSKSVEKWVLRKVGHEL